MIKDIITNQYFLLALTFGIYQGAKMLQRKTGSILLNPILIAIGLIILFLTTFNIPYETYYESGKMIDFWLKPAVVALGVPLYLQLSQIKKQFLPILAKNSAELATKDNLFKLCCQNFMLFYISSMVCPRIFFHIYLSIISYIFNGYQTLPLQMLCPPWVGAWVRSPE